MWSALVPHVSTKQEHDTHSQLAIIALAFVEDVFQDVTIGVDVRSVAERTNRQAY